ncbi:MAG: T9SS type A sorting domain-containing protein [Chitinispirillales bacterium]|jgi:hypothetical protein|nr:T9SS type A sorting domain-containing protein [Chitinispirillales bacterium]
MKRFLIAAAAVGLLAGLGAQAWATCTIGQNGTIGCCMWDGSAANCWGFGGTYDEKKTAAECTASSGVVVSDCEAEAPSTREFCDYGPCVGAGVDEYSCGDGGCYYLAPGGSCTGGTVVTTCPSDHLPPGNGGTGGGSGSGSGNGSGNGSGGGTAANCNADGVCENCQTDGKYSYCDWGTSCNSVNNKYGADNIGKTCEEVIANCRNYGTLFLGTSQPAGINEGNDYGAGVRCANLSELTQAPDLPVTDPTAPVENCKVDGKFSYCQWPTGCNSVNNKYGDNVGKTCDQVLNECQTNGALYLGATQPSGINEGNNYGEDVQCSSLPELTPTVGVHLLGNKSVAKGLKVSYAKNRVTVNWTPATKVSSGTVQLINMKGAAISTAFIKANSSKVSVKLGTVGVPAGMYFVHINAVGQNGKKIVTQSTISVVK